MCAVNRILVNLQQEEQKHLLAQGLPSGAGQEPREAEPSSALQVVPATALEPALSVCSVFISRSG